jgi:integrase
LGGGIHSLHWAQAPCLIAVYYSAVLTHLLFGEGIADIVEFMNRLSGMKRTGTTRTRKLASIRHFLKFLKDNDIIAGNPAETITRARKEEKDPAVLFKNEYKALLFEAQGNSRDYAILLTFLKTGIRESELAALKIADIDFSHDELRIREGKGKKGLCRKFCSGGREGVVAPVGGEIRRPGSRTVRPQ